MKLFAELFCVDMLNICNSVMLAKFVVLLHCVASVSVILFAANWHNDHCIVMITMIWTVMTLYVKIVISSLTAVSFLNTDFEIVSS